MPTSDFYRQKAGECVAAAKVATRNEEKARQYALAEHYMRLAMDESESKEKEPRKIPLLTWSLAMPGENIQPRKGDTRYVRRGAKGKFTSKHVSKGRSLAANRRSKAKTIVKKGEGDRGDQRRSKS
jgi:hypothetical protein